MRFGGFVAVLGAAVALACAHAPSGPAPSREVQDLERRLAESQTREAEQQRKIDELSNRLFILQDQLEARQVSAQQKAPPRLPVDANADRDDEGVEYVGAARDAHAPRPVLRLVGAQPLPRTPEVSGEAAGSREPQRAGRSAPPAARPSAEGSGDDRLTVTRYVPPVPPKESGGKSVAAPAPAQAPAPARASAVPPAASPVSAQIDAMKLYNASVDLLKHGQHAEAIAGFEKFIRSYPSHDYADNAQYWLGECYYDQKDYKTALREFRRVVQRYPSGNKVPDALLKVGYCYWQMQEAGKARDVLEQVVKSYPGTEIAKKAADKLHELK
ncbi:MAG TPA: tol-pal system protein YbgF [Polyangia bacterium]|nr:tol-pal system protein YbgF [Polyangia bacterium]